MTAGTPHPVEITVPPHAPQEPAVTTTAQHLRTIATSWTDLHEALGTPTTPTGFGIGLRGYLAHLEQLDADQLEDERRRALALRTLERDPAQIGERPIPLRVHILDTMRTIEAALVETADQTAAVVQRSPMPFAPRSWPAADRARRDQLARADAADPRRWRYTGRRTATYAALWLLARVERCPGPFTALPDPQVRHIARVAAGAAERVEQALDIAARVAPLAEPCPRFDCGGRIDVHGGAGASPVAHCTACGHIWTEQDAAA
jgi:hypothetical protein